MTSVVEPAREWRRAFVAAFVGSAGFLFLATLAVGLPIPGATAALILLGSLGLATIAACVVAGRPGHPIRRLEIEEDRLLADSREILRDEILDLRPDSILLEDGERLPIPPMASVRLRPLYRSALLARVRSRGRIYRHEVAALPWPARLARGYLTVFGAAVFVLVVTLGFRAGGAGLFVALGVGLATWYGVARALAMRRNDLVQAAGIETVTLDDAGIEVAEREGETTRIPWSEVEDVPPPARSGPVLVETAETDHVLPRRFHPSFARDLRAVWDAFVATGADPDDEDRGEPVAP